MTPNELLRPRIKCVIPYPDSPFPVGAILEQDFEEQEIYNYTDSNRRPWMVENPELYPEVFQPVQWWEDRKEEEMPEYLKSVTGLEVYQRVSRIDGAQVAIVKFHNGKYGKGTAGPIGLLNLLPATKQEYIEYIKQKEEQQ